MDKKEPKKIIKLRKNISKKRVFGLEIKRRHFKGFNKEKKDMIKMLNRSGFDRYIVLKRKNYLKRELSAKIGRKKGKWNTREKIEITSVNLETDEMINKFRSMDKFYEGMKKVLPKEKRIIMSYEDEILPGPKIAYKKILKFLDLKYKKVTVKTKKINKKTLKKTISNFGEVERCLRGTEYEWMLAGE